MASRRERLWRGELGPWEKEFSDFLRAFSGAFLFGMPLLFTMEMWWLGTYLPIWKMLALVVVAFFANLGLAYSAGFKHERTFVSAVEQAVDAIAVGIVASVVVLVTLGRINLGDPLSSILGQIAVQMLPLSLGASVANAVFTPNRTRESEGETPRTRSGWRATLNDVGATAVGGIFIGSSIAPTDEVPMLAASLNYPHALALVALSLLLTWIIVFESGFDPERCLPGEGGLFQHPLPETILAYVVSLGVAFSALLFFNSYQSAAPLDYAISQTLVLGLPTAVGGAAGRLVI